MNTQDYNRNTQTYRTYRTYSNRKNVKKNDKTDWCFKWSGYIRLLGQ